MTDTTTFADSTSAPDSGITFYGASWCGDCRRAKALLDREGVAFTYVDLEAEPDRAQEAKDISGRTNIPVIAFPDGTHQVEPSNPELQGKLNELGLAQA